MESCQQEVWCHYSFQSPPFDPILTCEQEIRKSHGYGESSWHTPSENLCIQGPYGFEETVAVGGIQLVVLGLLVIPFLWSLPLAYMTAELSCMITENGGHVLWVHRAFGPFLAFVNSFYGFVTSVLASAVCPALFVDYINTLLYGSSGSKMPSAYELLLKVGVVGITTLLNIWGIDIVGSISILFCLAVMTPFAGMIILGAPFLNVRWLSSPIPKPFRPGRFLMWIMWNTCGFDSIGTCVMEVEEPEKIYPPALGTSVCLVVLTYLVPTLVGASYFPEASQWHSGTYIEVTSKVGGQSLEVWLFIAAAVSCFGLLVAATFNTARQIYGMALLEQIPSLFSELHHKYGTPWAAILLSSVATLLLAGLNFKELAELEFMFYGLSTMLKMASLVLLRYYEPDTPRPFKIPLGNTSLAVAMLVPMGLCLTTIVGASIENQKVVHLCTIACMILYGLTVIYEKLNRAHTLLL